MRLCKDCRHYHDTGAAFQDYCSHPELAKPADLVRGEHVLTYCQIARETGRLCGIEGAKWEAKT